MSFGAVGRAIAAGVAGVCAGVLAVPVQADAYAMESGGTRWVTDENSDYCGDASPNSSNLFRTCVIGSYTDQSVRNLAGWDATIRASSTDWGVWDYSQNHYVFQYAYDSTGSTSNHITFYAGDLGGVDGSGRIHLADTSRSQIPGFLLYSQIRSVTITVNTNPAIAWCTTTSPCNSTTYLMEAVLDHEMGHGLGLAHPVLGPNDSSSVLECVIQQGETNYVRSDDRTGVLHYYSAHPNDFAAPGNSPC